MQETIIPGSCTCGAVRYRLLDTPLIVHCCHCTWCQRDSGSAFVVNGLIEADRVEVSAGTVMTVDTPTASGKGQQISRCPACYVALWSVYADMNDRIRFVRMGTLDEPGAFPPDIHIFTSTKRDWVRLDPAAAAVPEYYRHEAYWPARSLERYARASGSG